MKNDQNGWCILGRLGFQSYESFPLREKWGKAECYKNVNCGWGMTDTRQAD